MYGFFELMHYLVRQKICAAHIVAKVLEDLLARKVRLDGKAARPVYVCMDVCMYVCVCIYAMYVLIYLSSDSLLPISTTSYCIWCPSPLQQIHNFTLLKFSLPLLPPPSPFP